MLVYTLWLLYVCRYIGIILLCPVCVTHAAIGPSKPIPTHSPSEFSTK